MTEQQARPQNVFTNRNFRLVFFGALVSELGTLLYSFAVGFYMLEISSNNAFLQGLYLALCGIALLLLTPAGGVLGDRMHKGRIMSVCDYIKGALILLSVLLMLLFRSGQAHIIILFAVGLLGNAVSGVFTPAAESLLPHIVDEDRLQQANAYSSIRNSLQSIFGVALAGVLYAALPIQALFALVGACYIASGVSEMFIRYEHKPAKDVLTFSSALGDMRDGLSYLRTQKALLAMLGAMVFINFFFSPITGNFLPYFIKTDVAGADGYLFDGLLTPELWLSVFSILISVSSLVGAALLSAKEQAQRCGLATAVKLCGIALVMTSLAVSYLLLVSRGASLNLFLMILSAMSLILGFLIVYINIPATTMIMRVVDSDKLGKVMSIVSITLQGLTPIASLLAGAALEYLGSTFLLFICAAGFSVTALLMLFNRRVREI